MNYRMDTASTCGFPQILRNVRSRGWSLINFIISTLLPIFVRLDFFFFEAPSAVNIDEVY